MSFTRCALSAVALVCAAVHGGQLSGSYEVLPLGSTVDLTAQGPADWVHWGLNNDRAVDRKSGVGPQIGTFTPLTGEEDFSAAAQWYPNAKCGYSWTDGTPTASATDTTTGVYLFTSYLPLRLMDPRGAGNTFAFSFLTQPNRSYTVGHASVLPALSWNVITNFPGSGQVVTVTNPLPAGAGEGYYRVWAQ
jgi:hypothetical protein